MATGGAVAVAASAVIVLSNAGGETQVVTKEVPVETVVQKLVTQATVGVMAAPAAQAPPRRSPWR